jgi:hypothetical protein
MGQKVAVATFWPMLLFWFGDSLALTMQIVSMSEGTPVKSIGLYTPVSCRHASVI